MSLKNGNPYNVDNLLLPLNQWYNVNPSEIDPTYFNEPRENRDEEDLRENILWALGEMEKHPLRAFQIMKTKVVDAGEVISVSEAFDKACELNDAWQVTDFHFFITLAYLIIHDDKQWEILSGRSFGHMGIVLGEEDTQYHYVGGVDGISPLTYVGFLPIKEKYYGFYLFIYKY